MDTRITPPQAKILGINVVHFADYGDLRTQVLAVNQNLQKSTQELAARIKGLNFGASTRGATKKPLTLLDKIENQNKKDPKKKNWTAQDFKDAEKENKEALLKKLGKPLPVDPKEREAFMARVNNNLNTEKPSSSSAFFEPLTKIHNQLDSLSRIRSELVNNFSIKDSNISKLLKAIDALQVSVSKQVDEAVTKLNANSKLPSAIDEILKQLKAYFDVSLKGRFLKSEIRKMQSPDHVSVGYLIYHDLKGNDNSITPQLVIALKTVGKGDNVNPALVLLHKFVPPNSLPAGDVTTLPPGELPTRLVKRYINRINAFIRMDGSMLNSIPAAPERETKPTILNQMVPGVAKYQMIPNGVMALLTKGADPDEVKKELLPHMAQAFKIDKSNLKVTVQKSAKTVALLWTTSFFTKGTAAAKKERQEEVKKYLGIK